MTAGRRGIAQSGQAVVDCHDKDGVGRIRALSPQRSALSHELAAGKRHCRVIAGYATGRRVNARSGGPDQKEVDALIASFDNN